EHAAYYKSNDQAAEMVLALARIAHPSSRDVLRARLSDSNPAIRRAAAEGLGRLNDRDSLDAIRTLAAKDPSPAARLAATFAGGFLGEPQFHLIAGAVASPDLAAQARGYLLEIGPPAIPGVQSGLSVATDGRF